MLIAVSVVLLLMQFMVPSFAFRRVYRRNAPLFGPRTISVTDSGIASDHQLGYSEASWSAYLKFHETEQSFLLYQPADLISIVPKRAFSSPDDLQEFKALLTAKVAQA